LQPSRSVHTHTRHEARKRQAEITKRGTQDARDLTCHHVESDRICKKARPKLKALLRTKHFNSLSSLIIQYKAHVLTLLEGSALAMYHAAAMYLDKLDRVQRSFLREVDLSEEQAFLEFNLAPLSLRRDIAAQGFLHKISLGECHPEFQLLFPPASQSQAHRHDTRHSRVHTRALQDRVHGGCLGLMQRSLFAAVRVYNKLPQHIADRQDISGFQHDLTEIARSACRGGQENWQSMFRYQPLSA
jgi:hypothetical protein